MHVRIYVSIAIFIPEKRYLIAHGALMIAAGRHGRRTQRIHCQAPYSLLWPPRSQSALTTHIQRQRPPLPRWQPMSLDKVV